MSRPKPEDLTSVHGVARSNTDELGLSTALLEAYKKHAQELRGIEDSQSKTVALLVGIFSAAGTLLFNGSIHLTCISRAYTSAVAFVIVALGNHAINEFHDLRIAVRDLLVRCEVALRFHEIGAFLEGRPLYTRYELGYATRGTWMKRNYWIVWLVWLAFVCLLWVR